MYSPRYDCYCPFYENEYKKCVCCSGLGTVNRISLEFNSEEEKYNYIRQHCIKKYPEDCVYFKCIAINYDKDW